ncbi:MAG TPA: hypothetical protein PKU91_07665, partial [Phycisphaerales bacterium]|nr:hypothetical protein [Phycisphaerales bacterium]
VTIDSISLVSYHWPLLTIDVACGKGTYMRSLARDIGLALGTGGVLDSLRRTEVAPYSIDHARNFHDLPGNLIQADLDPVPGNEDSANPPDADQSR